MKRFEFAVYYDVTDFAKDTCSMMFEQYEKVYVCSDTWDFWIARILPNTNTDYEHEEDVFLLERNKIQKDHKGQGISTLKQLEDVLEQDDGSNYDYYEYHDINDAIDDIDGGFGIEELEYKKKDHEQA